MYDHVLGNEERRRNAFAKVCACILNNPVRAQLASNAGGWKFAGAIVPGCPDLHPLDEEFWRTFWKLYATMHHAGAKRALPARNLTL
jgi:putative transposase